MALLRSTRRGHWHRWSAAAAVALLATAAGCHPWSTTPADSAASQIAADKPTAPQNPRRDATAPRNPADARSNGASAVKLDPLADPYWVAVPANTADPLAETIAALKDHADLPLEAASAPSGKPQRDSRPPYADTHHRWRHPGLERLIAETPDHRPDLHAKLASSDPVVATNAAILLGRDGNPVAVEPLLRAIQSPQTNTWQRRAAIEALADIRDPSIVPRLQKLIDDRGDFSGAARLNYNPEIHADLLRSLIRAEFHGETQPPAGGEPQLAAALDSPAAVVRREALLGLADPKSGALPDNIVRYAADEDRSVRQAAIIAIAARHHPQALEIMRRGFADQDLDVRLATVAGYGLVGGSEATAELKHLSNNSAELIRAAAYSALIDLHDPEALAAAAVDKSWRVRRLTAAAVARDSSRRSRDLATRLVADGNADVARQVIDSVSHWPLDQAGPVLLDAMEGLAYTPRKLAAAQLAERWAPAVSFEIDAPADRRARLSSELRRRWKIEFATTMPQKRVDHEPLPEANADPATELTAVERLKTDDVRERRRAAEALRTGFAARPLSESALARLAELMTRELDTLVWVSVFGLLADDVREPAIRLAYGALGHPSPEVRRRACEQLAAHPDRRHGPLLLVSLADSNSVVVEAAVKALGRLDSLDDSRPLERLLASDDHQLRVEVAEALVHVGADAGIAALERLAFDSDPKVRRAAAAAMGEVPDASFLPTLIHLLDDRTEIRRAALASLPRVAGRDVPAAELPAGAAASPASASAVNESQRWKEWFRQQPAVKLQ